MLGNRDLADLCRYLDSGLIDRREFLRNAVVAGASASLGAALAAAPNGAAHALETIEGPEKRAWELAKSAAAKAPKKTLTVLYPSGAVGNLSPYVDLWKKELGIDIELIEEPGATMHSKGMQEAVTKAGRYDVIQGTSVSLPDWADAGAILDLTDYVDKYKPDLFDENWGVVPPAAYYGEIYKGRVYALWFDNDEWTLLLRSDYLNDPAERENFNKKFGHELAPPNTWKQYDDQVKFFHRPEKKFFGSLEYRSRFYVKWVFMQRFASKGKVYFDADMNCQFDSPEGLETLEELLALNPYLHPDAFNFTWDSNYNAYGRGEGYVNLIWPSGYKYAKVPSTGPATAGKVIGAPMPGNIRPDGSVLRTPILPFGWYWVVGKYSKVPDLAYAYIQWMQSPTISADAIPYLGGYADPFRKNHMLQPTQKLIDAYSVEYLHTLYDNAVNLLPDFVLPHGYEYQDALDKEVQACMTGQIKPKEALQNATREIERITRRAGREKQKEAWRSLAKNLSPPLKKAAGVDSWG
jgi:multiple sugar transport system substrate-binding protein